MWRALLAGAIGWLTLSATAAHAQQVYWDDSITLGAGQRSTLDLVFEGTEPAGPVTLPHIDGLTVLGPPSQESSVSIVNGTRSGSMTLGFPVRAEREGTLAIPAFDVSTTAGRRSVAALKLEVGAATLPGGARGAATKVDDVVEARLTPTNMTPYAGEVFDLDATVGLTGGRNGQVVGTPSWEKSGLVAEPWGDGRQVTTRNGSGVRFHTRAVAPQAGRLEVSPAQQEVQIEGPRQRIDPFGDMDDAFGGFRRFGGADLLDSFFARAQMTSATVKSNALQLDVRPLPPAAPAGFSGAVGQFEIESTLAPAQPNTGEPVTWTVTLKGTGNWPGGVELPARAVPADFRTLQPKQHKDFADGELFSGSVSEDLVMVPNQPGDYHLAPVRFVYFDPTAEAYRTIEAQPPVLHITGAPIAAQPQTAELPAAPAAAAAPAVNPATSAPMGHDLPLPHDPLRGTTTAITPLAAPHVAPAAAVPLVLLLGYWLMLAVRHARRTDPRRPQREAFKQLRPCIERIRGAADPTGRLAALIAWQHTAVTAMAIDHAAPTAAQLPDERWSDVWAASEAALYQREHALPAGWCDRALALCTRARRPRFNPLRALTMRHWIPRAATAALLLAVAAARAQAGDGVDAYVNGDFAGAREQFLARAQAVPSDWIARYDLGLVAAQQGDPARALGETIAAFVHAPRNDDVRWNARAFAERVPGLDRGAAALIGAPSVAAIVSPATWQALLIGGALLISAGAALGLQRRYGSRRARGGLVLAVIGGGIGAAALFSLHAYGALADLRAAVVAGQPVLRSVPTEAEPAAQQKPLAAGTLVVVEQDFLGWTKVGLESGETGWLRHGDLVPLYAAPTV
jgi:hypothetical protein